MRVKKVRDPQEVFRDEMVMQDRIVEFLGDEPKTIPELAQGLGAPSHEIMCWVMAMRRHQILVEGEDADEEGYYRYGLARGEEENGKGK